MKPILIIFSLFILNSQFSILNSTLWEIKQDGTGDFTTITAGIDTAQSRDTLLVYPGTYYENINFSGKDIVITSLYRIESNDRQYIEETIIDGNRNGTVVRANTRETVAAVLSGFTITNGYDARYGGVFVGDWSALTIKYCIVEYNHSPHHVGGVASRGSLTEIILIGNIVRYNTGGNFGGFWATGRHTFCIEEPNSFYFNYGAWVADIALHGTSQPVLVFDTMTVRDSPDLFLFYLPPENVPPGFEIIIKNAKIELEAADLYVSPDGCDSNSGLSPEEPLQRIGTALLRIRPDRSERRTIHLAEGIYSPSLNDQWFPVGVRDYVDIIGVDKETTILSGDDDYTLLSTIPSANDSEGGNIFTIKNLTLTNAFNGSNYSGTAFGAISFGTREYFTLENIIITNTVTGSNMLFIHIQKCEYFTLKNIDINNNRIGGRGESRLLGISGTRNADSIYGENIRINNNHSPDGGGRISFRFFPLETQSHHITLANFELTNNSNSSEQVYEYGRQLGMSANVRLINATVAGNRVGNALNPAAFTIDDYYSRYSLSVYNSIFYDNGSDYQIYVSRHPSHGEGPDVINVSHSLIENGEDAIFSYHNVPFILNWGEGNIDEDPLFVGEDVNPDYPYMLSENSPVRGAGTLDIPGFEFPEFDLAGNPRIVDGQIDMGAYQWHPPTSVEDDVGTEYHTVRPDYNLRNFPNPAVTLVNHRTVGVEGHRSSTTGTNIAFEAPEAGNVVVEIYNLKGQFVKRLFDAYIPEGEHNIFWDGRDERGRYVATGFYMYNLLFNDQVVATGRATFIK